MEIKKTINLEKDIHRKLTHLKLDGDYATISLLIEDLYNFYVQKNKEQGFSFKKGKKLVGK